MMRALGTSLVYVLALVGLWWTLTVGYAQAPSSAEMPGALSAVQTLKAENFQLRVEVAHLRATLADRETRLLETQLSQEQRTLIEEFRVTLRAGPDEVFDWKTLTFTPKEVATK